MPTTPTVVLGVEAAISGGLTYNRIDQARAVMALRAASTDEERRLIMEIVIRKRSQWLTWMTVTQRQWQRNRRTITARSIAVRRVRWGNKHDYATLALAEIEAVRTREKYVRCAL
jgi:hypothetical protein